MRMLLATVLVLALASLHPARAEEPPAAAEADGPALVEIGRLQKGGGLVRSLAWSDDGARLVAGTSKRQLLLYEPPSLDPAREHVFDRYG